jgi:hypothetical protein
MGKSRVGSSIVLILKTGQKKYRGFAEPCYGVLMGKIFFTIQMLLKFQHQDLS